MGKVLTRYQGMTLEQFLELPERKPALEYIDGIVEAKPMPKRHHSVIQEEFSNKLNQFARPHRLGRSFIELRCTFGGQSYVPDVAFQLQRNIPIDTDGKMSNEGSIVPDIHVEITSPKQSLERLRSKFQHSLAHGCQLAWLINLEAESVEVHRPGQGVLKLEKGDVLEGEPVLTGFHLPVDEIFGWLTI